MTDISERRHPEKTIDGFTTLDGTVRFYNYVRAVLLRTNARDVLDFGAGRGAALIDDRSLYRRQLRDLRTLGARVTACDVDEAVKSHPASDRQVMITPGSPLPFADSTFDVIVSDMTFEHIENAKFVSGELLRVLKPGGYICARTPNRFGYVRLVSGLVPNAMHSMLLRFVQPDRKPEDVFPTVYRMNGKSQIQRLFGNCAVVVIHDNADPAYYFGNGLLYRVFLFVHAVLPRSFSTTLYMFIRKPGVPAGVP